MSVILKVVNPLALDFADERFRVSYLPADEKLLLSIRAAGLVQPPVFVERERRLVLLAGWKRALACRRLGLRDMRAWILPEQDDLKSFRLALFDNLASRGLTLMEKAETTARLLRFGERRERLLDEVLPLLGVSRRGDTLDVLLRAAAMAPGIRQAAERNIGDLAVLREFIRFAPPEQAALLPWLRTAGRNKQREVLEDLLEAARLEGRTPLEIMQDGDIREILGSVRLQAPQKTDLLRAALKRKRYPSYSRRRGEFESLMRRAGWPRRAAVEAAPFFEDDHLTVKFRFRSKREFQALLSEMGLSAEREEFSKALRCGAAEDDDDVPA